MVQPNYGLPSGGYAPTQPFADLYPYYALGPNTALQMFLAQFNGGIDAQIAAQQAQASQANAATSAAAQVQSAGINAQGGIQQQLISSGASLQGLQAQIIGDLEAARNGDIAAAQRLWMTNDMIRQQSNQQTSLELSKLGGSGQLRDYFAKQLYLNGGDQPGIFSSMEGVPSPFIGKQAAPLTPPMYKAPTVGGLNYSGGGGGFGGGGFSSSGGFSGGGGGGGFSFQAPNYTDILAQVMGAFDNQTPAVGNSGGGAAPAAPTTSYTPPPKAAGTAGSTTTPSPLGPGGPMNAGDQPYIVKGVQRGILHPDGSVTRFMAHGGTLSPGEGALVGEGKDGSGLRRGTAEILRFGKDGKIEIIPIAEQMATGGTLNAPVGPTASPAPVIPNTPITPAPYDPSWVPNPNFGKVGPNGVMDNNPGYNKWMGATNSPGTTVPTTMAPVAALTRPQFHGSAGTQNWYMPNPMKSKFHDAPWMPKPAPPPAPFTPPPPPAPIDAGSTTITTPDGTTVNTTTPPAAPPAASNPATFPWLEELRSGSVSTARPGQLRNDVPGTPGFGQDVPMPWDVASTIRQQDPYKQKQYFDLLETLGLPPEAAAYWMNRHTAGYRGNAVGVTAY